MPVLSIFAFDEMPPVFEVCKALNIKDSGDAWITAKPSKYNNSEVFIQFWYYENVGDTLGRFFTEEDMYEIVSYLKENGRSRVLKRTYCFINLATKTLEIYRGHDERTAEIVAMFEKLLGVKFTPLLLESKALQRLYNEHGIELNQALFKNVEGLLYTILRGNCLEENGKYNEYLKKFPDYLRVISFRPRIKFLNGGNKYQVTVNGDKGTVKLSSWDFAWRPRFEVRQIVFILASVLGVLPSVQ